ncbi:MAG: hypothetical protein Q7T20_13275, partial [Saprospiraceae bacterium]|nr:hypothetical protein [Saprospiraceae bacterium]
MKKSNFHKILSMAIWWTFASATLFAQSNVNMAANGNTGTFTIAPPMDCFFNFFDNGGAALNYNNGANATVTFVPSNTATHRIQVRFSSFGLEAGYDAFYIYNANFADPARKVNGPQGPTLSGFPGGNWQTISPGTVTANLGIAAVGANADEALTFQFRSDNSISMAGWTAIVSQVPKVTCDMNAPSNLNAFTGPLADSCFVNVATNLPTFVGGCNVGYQLQYRVNGGNAIPVPAGPGMTSIHSPVGNNVISWELVDSCGGGIISSRTQIINVIDNTPPQITCPVNTTINLQPGLCETNNYTYQVSCTDNCMSLSNQSGQVNHPIDFNGGQAGIMFDVTNLSSNTMTLTEFGPSLDFGNWPMEVYFTTNVGSFLGFENNPLAWTLAGKNVISSLGSANGTPISGFGISIPAGQTRGIYITSSTGAPINFTNGVRQMSDGNLRVSSNPGSGKAYPFGNNFPNKSYNGYVKYAIPGINAPMQTAGIPSGENYPIGTTTNTFECFDGVNTVTCSWTVTVVGFVPPTENLTCNNLINFSLGPDCSGTLTAGQVLSGGPYKCYDFYPVQVDKTLPYGDGPWEPAVFDCEDIGKTYAIRVYDDKNGNGIRDLGENLCTGNVKIFDDFPPVLLCSPDPITIPFNFPLDPEFSQNTTIQLPFKSQGLPLNVGGGQTREFLLPVNLPMNATVNDVELRVKISGDALSADLNIQIESPSSTLVTTWDGSPAVLCGALPLFVRFDDEGTPNPACDSYTTDKHAQIPFGFGALNNFDGELANGVWKIRISDEGPFGDVSTIEIADLYITITGNFGAGFPNGLSAPPVTPNGFQSYLVPKMAAINSDLDHCSAVTLTYTDQSVNQPCASGLLSIVTRTWTAQDASGHTSSCDQTIRLLLPSLTDVVFPPDYNGIEEQVFNCTIGEYPSPDWIENQGLVGLPRVFGIAIGGNIVWEHHDTPVWICDGSYSISREWTAIDACTGKILKHTQLVQVIDAEGPVFLAQQPNITVTTNADQCCSTTFLPDVLLMDSCSQINNIQAQIKIINPVTGMIVNTIPVAGGLFNFPGNPLNHPDTLGAFSLSPCLPIGEHIVTYIAQDDCGNTSSMSFKITVGDFNPPVASCNVTTVVAIGKDDPNDCYLANFANCEFAGVSWVSATVFDDGSYDVCSNVKFTIQRSAPYSDCIEDLSNTPCSGNAGGLSEFDIATIEADSIKFYCCEVGTELKVILRVYQLNPDGTISTTPDGDPIFNECEVTVQVQDKLKPTCVAPFNVTVNCENFDPSLWTYGKASVYDNCCLDLAYEYQGQKGLTHSVNYSNFDTVCNKGTIMRTFKVYDCHGATSQCTQRIVVNYDQNYFIKFPDDAIVSVCQGSGVYGEPQFFGEDCELLGVSFQDQVFTVVPDACFKIERTWTIINWCTYQPNLNCIYVPNPNPNSNSNHVTNMPGPIVSACGTAAPWASTVVKINPTDQTTTNYCTFYDKNANCYKYKQIIKIIDTQAPIMLCPAGPLEFCDLTPNDAQLWNESYWLDPVTQLQDLSEAPVDLGVSGTDFCSGSNLNIHYLLFLDLNGDGIMETVVNSSNAPAAGTVNYNNLNTPNFAGGTPRQFDERPVSANQKYRFAIETTVNGTSLGASVRWNTPAAPATYVEPELPYGTHKIKWFIGDGCGNESVCEYTFVIKDCKAPSIVCQNGLSSNLPQSDMITLWASDFLLYAEDNWTPADELLFGLRKCNNPVPGFPVDGNGNPIISLTFDCSELGLQCVELWAKDGAGNADYCETFLIVQDNAGNCGSASATVAGLLKTEMGEGLEETDVELVGPTFNMFDLTDQDGYFAFSNAVPMHADYTITPTKDDNPLNGVTTYDLVLISKHILGIEPLASPYKMIAADANRSGSITTFDIVELRKLILGIYNDLPANDSWRFVDKSFVFPNIANPFQTGFPETKTVAGIQANAIEDNFVAIKVGDLNATAIANNMMSVEERTSSTLLFDVEDRTVKAGEVFEVKFKAVEKVAGYQFTLNYNDLDLMDIVPGPGMKADNFATFANDNALTTSFDGTTQAEFTLKFKATKAGDLNKMLRVSSRITKAEGYQISPANDQPISRMEVALRFNSKEGSTISGVGFELYQNQPNPFVNRTLVGFHLPDAATAT